MEKICYSGSKTEGQKTLRITTHEPVNLSIQGHKDPPFTYYGFANKHDTPYTEAMSQAILSGLFEIWSHSGIALSSIEILCSSENISY